jgi:site-specific DNA-methyltransferase (adenine-specific)
MGYPTQKPLKLLERILEISSDKDDVVLDGFCGCGTALVASENLGRQWIGVDVSPTACRVMAKRLRNVCKIKEDEKLWKIGRGFVVRDLPWSEDKLRKIPPFEFENWAVIALGGMSHDRGGRGMMLKNQTPKDFARSSPRRGPVLTTGIEDGQHIRFETFHADACLV